MLKGQIKPILKDNSLGKTQSGNYRPIMNSSNFLKIFESCLGPIIDRYIVLNKRQFGFRAKTSCLSAHIILKEIIKKYNSENSNVYSAMVDISKAFDKVNHSILINTLQSLSLPISVSNTIKNMFDNTYANVCVNGIYTSEWRIRNGTRQGGLLSPKFFALYINKMIEKISEMEVGCNLAGIRTNIICFANDVCLLSPCPKALQSMLDLMHQEVSKLSLTVNTDKCAFLIFKSHRHSNINAEVNFKGQALKRVKFFKYLGIILSENMCIKDDIGRSMSTFLKQFNGMFYKFHKMNSQVLNYLFKTYTNSFYGIEMWYDNWKYRGLKNIAVTYHKAVKKIAHMNVWESNHVACETVGVPIFKHLLSKRIICFFDSLIKTESPCLSIFKYYFKYQSFINSDIDTMLTEMYSVDNFKNNPLCAILSRIMFVERHEPRSHYMPGGQGVGDGSSQ